MYYCHALSALIANYITVPRASPQAILNLGFAAENKADTPVRRYANTPIRFDL
jgi:hypothetical protein